MFKVLLVDDTRSVHAFMKSLLSKWVRVEVRSVFNGAEAVNLLMNNQNFDLISLDWEMPEMDGPEAFLELKKMKIEIPTLMVTTKNSPEDIGKILAMGVSEYVMKPFTLDILLDKIESVTGRTISDAA
jgi:CheY-like chemotaxis protein